jgi:hypothetical protein
MNEFRIKGTVRELTERTTSGGKQIASLILEIPGFKGKVDPVSITVFGRSLETVRGYGAGEVVKVTGRVSGRQWNDRVFSDLVLDSIEADAPKHSERRTSPPSDDIDDVGF